MTLLDTPLGQVRFSVDVASAGGTVPGTQLRVMDFEPILPKGMSVRRVRAVLLKVEATEGLCDVNYLCRLDADVEGGPESGQHLDTISWEDDHSIVVVGTEDTEMLSARLPWLTTSTSRMEAVKYRKDGIEIKLDRVPKNTMVTLHFIIAENENPEPMECSAWYAVDALHAHVLRMSEQM